MWEQFQRGRGRLTPLLVQLLEDLSDDLADRLQSLDIILGLVEIPFEVAQREPDCSRACHQRHGLLAVPILRHRDTD